MILGTMIGKHKLIPSVSPKKSVEGSVCGLGLGTFISVLFFKNVIGIPVNIFVLILMTLFLSVIGQLGDLLFSKIKRENNIKDFSNIMPGHGGILDRLDSLALVLLAFAIIVKFI
jgi:phosphatidate cytidylyltransferase